MNRLIKLIELRRLIRNALIEDAAPFGTSKIPPGQRQYRATLLADPDSDQEDEPTQPTEGESGQPSLPVGGTAPAPKGATSNQSKPV